MRTATRELVTIAASAGGISALQRLLARLPPDLPAALLVVLHMPATSRGSLPRVLQRSSRMPVTFAADGQRPEPGHVLIAPPNRHLMVDADVVRLSSGPRHNGVRPAADPLFFSAAVARGPGAVGVVLSGALDDGSAGCAAIEAAGGLVAVQDPHEAAYQGMPTSAMGLTHNAFVGGIVEIADYLDAQTRLPVPATSPAADPETARRVRAMLRPEGGREDVPPGVFSNLTCPDCGGPLYAAQDAEPVRFECLIGHSWSPAALLEGQSAILEQALSMAIRQLEERQRLSRRLAESAGRRGHYLSARRFEETAAETTVAVDTLQRLLTDVIVVDGERGGSDAVAGGREQ